MVSIFLAQAIQNKQIHVKGSAVRFRDFIYIDDVVKAFLKTEATLENSGYYFFNVCTGIKTTVDELVKLITNHFNTNISVKFEGATPGDQFGIFGNPAKMHDIIGHWDKIKFKEGIKAFVNSIK